MLKKLIPSTPKLTAKLTYNKKKKLKNSNEKTKKFNIYTSYIKIHCIDFSEKF